MSAIADWSMPIGYSLESIASLSTPQSWLEKCNATLGMGIAVLSNANQNDSVGILELAEVRVIKND